MNKILVEVSVGELLDKISILEIKKEKIKDPEKLKFINDEYEVLKNQLNQNVKSDDKLDNLFNSLKDIFHRYYVSQIYLELHHRLELYLLKNRVLLLKY